MFSRCQWTAISWCQSSMENHFSSNSSSIRVWMRLKHIHMLVWTCIYIYTYIHVYNMCICVCMYIYSGCMFGVIIWSRLNLFMSQPSDVTCIYHDFHFGKRRFSLYKYLYMLVFMEKEDFLFWAFYLLWVYVCMLLLNQVYSYRSLMFEHWNCIYWVVFILSVCIYAYDIWKHVNLYHFWMSIFFLCLEKHVVSFWTSMHLVFLVKAYGFILGIGLKGFSKSTWFHSACILDIFSEKPEVLYVSGNIWPVVFWKAKVEPSPSKHGDKYCLLLFVQDNCLLLSKLQILLHLVIRISVFLCYQAHELKTEHCTSL